MANNIQLFKQYIDMLDEVYVQESKTAVLDGNADLVKQGANANELVIPIMEMSGLADYDKENNRYVEGTVKMVYETRKCGFDKGRMFTIDEMDNEETAGIAFGNLSSEFIRTKVVPHIDAYRFSQYASKGTLKQENLTTGDQVVKALRTAVTAMDNAEVPTDGRILFITPTLKGLVDDLDTNKSKAVLSRFSSVVEVPQARFAAAITGTTDGFSVEATDYLNFQILHKAAVIQFQKRQNSKIVTPEQNPDADAWKYGYRNVSIADAYQNKLSGIYTSQVSSAG